MRALLLAAGLGTRLKPLTNYLPKCLIPIHGRPLLDYWLESLVTHGVNEILLNTHYFSSLVVDYVQRSSWAHNVTMVHEDQLWGTGGTILANRNFFREQAFLVAHADNLTIFDPLAFFKQHGERPPEAALTMMVFETPDPKSCGIVALDQRGMVTSFHEKVASPPGNLANAAVYILVPSVLDFMASLGKAEIDFSNEVIPHFMGRIQTHSNAAYHRDIGTVASWMEAHEDFQPMPASPLDAKAWAETLKLVDPALQITMTQLLAQARSTAHGLHEPTVR
jgi:mannose-1-phosphate guanylyltransferase